MRVGRVAALVACLAMLPLGCYFLGKPVLMRLQYGRAALSREQHDSINDSMIGMTTSQVLARLGPPHDELLEDDGSERWYYWNDPYGIAYIGLRFGPGGRFEGWWT